VFHVTHEDDWVQKTKALAENVGLLWRVREADNTRIKTLELKVRFLTGLACFTTALAIGGLMLLAFGWWATNG
jgi:hypothetical protein